jgi:phage host-nuclease inhibitor protein Gam
LAAVAVQQVVTLSEDIEANLEPFKAYGETAKDKVDKVDKTKLLELLAEEVIRIGLPVVPTTKATFFEIRPIGYP